MKVRATDLGPAVVFVSSSNINDNGRKINLKVEVYRNSTLIASGTLNDKAVDGTTQSDAKRRVVPLTMNTTSEDFAPNDLLSIKVYGQKYSGSGNVGARLWYNDHPDSVVNTTMKGYSYLEKQTEGGSTGGYYYLCASQQLETQPDSNGLSVQRSLGTEWVLFDTWTMFGSSMKPATSAVPGAATSASLFPNPVYTGHGELRLSLSKGGTAHISIHDLLGSTLIQLPPIEVEQAAAVSIPLDISALGSGVYRVRIETPDEAITTNLTVVH